MLNNGMLSRICGKLQAKFFDTFWWSHVASGCCVHQNMVKSCRRARYFSYLALWTTAVYTNIFMVVLKEPVQCQLIFLISHYIGRQHICFVWCKYWTLNFYLYNFFHLFGVLKYKGTRIMWWLGCATCYKIIKKFLSTPTNKKDNFVKRLVSVLGVSRWCRFVGQNWFFVNKKCACVSGNIFWGKFCKHRLKSIFCLIFKALFRD